MYVYKHIYVNMCKYNWPLSRNIQYNFIQLSTVKLLDAMKTDSDQFMITYKKKIRNNEINISNNNVITVSYKYAMII